MRSDRKRGKASDSPSSWIGEPWQDLVKRERDNTRYCGQRSVGQPSLEDSADEDELVAIGEAIEAYELKRWPEAMESGGKG